MFKTDFEMGYRDNTHGSIESCFFYYSFILFSIYVIACSFEKY